jgi:prepilin-type N-terminal cleavage/methylation domain-containing protein
LNGLGRWHRNRRKQAGFTLIEVFIALFVFSIAALAIAAMTFMSIQGNAMTNQMSQANFLAQDKMEELLSFQTYEDFKDTGLSASSEPVAGDGIIGPGGAYTRAWSASCPPGTPPPLPDPNPNPDLDPTACQITVTVSWADSKGNHDVDVVSLWRASR